MKKLLSVILALALMMSLALPLAAQGEILEENDVMMNRVMDAVKTYLEEYNETHNFAAILTTSGTTNAVIVGNPALNITKEILEGLNSEYVKSRNSSTKDE